ncbi:DNA polymerase III subunit delta' [Marinomonas ostreistagni]|uniref:DNA polymerase III subunit delta' n=1 Tax=Marinomonas ostreistagni TaxID=359209 RepID=UPI00195026DD|nr:DNA polymerase III subunit delta' [Marinomonas ostreistagni]MBM6550286.1 DNA polymerase III subunit delta' [Marinomonas ostreistagni]
MADIKSLPIWLEADYQQAQQWRRSGKFHHALLLTGNQGIGQSALADALARLLLCERAAQAPCGECHSCQVALAETHPDWLTLDGRAGASIKVDAVRQLVTKVTNKPQLGYSKVVTIHDAHQMNINAANAILKALEEPPAATYFILTSNSSRALMPTILSRCQRVNLPTPSAQQVSDWLIKETNSDVSKLMWFSNTPYHLLSLVETPSYDMLQKLPDSLVSWLSGHIRVDEFVAYMNKDHVQDFVDGLLALLTSALQYSATGRCDESVRHALEALLQRYDLYRLMHFVQQLTLFKSQLDKTHLNPTIQLTGELNSW